MVNSSYKKEKRKKKRKVDTYRSRRSRTGNQIMWSAKAALCSVFVLRLGCRCAMRDRVNCPISLGSTVKTTFYAYTQNCIECFGLVQPSWRDNSHSVPHDRIQLLAQSFLQSTRTEQKIWEPSIELHSLNVDWRCIEEWRVNWQQWLMLMAITAR